MSKGERRTKIEWTEVPGFLGYFVSEDGSIRGPRRVLCPMRNEGGYLYVIAHRRKLFVHKAVLLAFVGPCPPGEQCRHLDGDQLNCRRDNLEWGTPLKNADDKRRHGTQPTGERSGTAKLTELQVREIRLRVGGETLRALAVEYGVSHTAIRRAAIGAKWRHVA